MDWVVPGAVLAGKYVLERKLGQGGMGAVWRAEHVQLRSPVAIKLIDEQIAQHPEALARFMREAQSAAALRGPHVVQIFDYGADRGVPYIAMELLEGESLAARLERVDRIAPVEVGRIISEVARAIGKAHELTIVHRDLKPDNIFLVLHDDVEVTKVLDFGIAKATQGLGVASGDTRTGAILGTPHYMSPEQAEGTKLVDHRTDLWALGVIAFECLVGRRPFDSDALGSLLLAICTRPIPVPSAWGYDLPGFDAWFAKACAREPSDRFQSARELANELRRVVGAAEGQAVTLTEGARAAFAATAAMQTPFVAVPATAGVPSAPAPVAPSKSRTPIVLAGLAAVAIVGGIAAVAMRKPPAPLEVATAALTANPPTASAFAPLAASVTARDPSPSPSPSMAPAAPASSVAPASSAVPPVVAPVVSGSSLAPASKPRTRERRVERSQGPKPPASSAKINLGI